MGGVISSPIKAVLGSVSQPTTVSAPSTAVVSQSSTSATETETVKKRRRGKSPTILTSASGVEQNATLGTTSLLGQ